MGTRWADAKRFYEELASFADEYNRGPTTGEIAVWLGKDRREVRARLRRLKARDYIIAREQWYGNTMFVVWVIPLWSPRNALLWFFVRLSRLVRRAWAWVKGLVKRAKK